MATTCDLLLPDRPRYPKADVLTLDTASVFTADGKGRAFPSRLLIFPLHLEAIPIDDGLYQTVRSPVTPTAWAARCRWDAMADSPSRSCVTASRSASTPGEGLRALLDVKTRSGLLLMS